MKKSAARPGTAAKIRKVRDILFAVYGPQKCFLNHFSPFQLLVATILSAQCTDKTVNTVTPALFKRYPDAESLASADESELETLIHPCGFFRAKGKNLRAMAACLVSRFHGEVPRTMEELVSLPGVGRKTANVVLSEDFDVPGLPVDTHVLRLSGRIGLDTTGDPVHVESVLCAALKPEQWKDFSHHLILHGRTRCPARKPDCAACEIASLCAAREKEMKKK